MWQHPETREDLWAGCTLDCACIRDAYILVGGHHLRRAVKRLHHHQAISWQFGFFSVSMSALDPGGTVVRAFHARGVWHPRARCEAGASRVSPLCERVRPTNCTLWEIVPVPRGSLRWQGIGRPWLWRVTGN